jgi:6-pyruvoyltetrahydropterin/6-carboxytetrahydropterin synthase
MIYIKRKEHFCAAHKLWNDNWDAETNRRVFGKCSNENYHGHNFELEVTVKGEIDPNTGFVMNLFELKQIVREHIIDVVDHKNFNLDIDFMQGKFPTAEVISMEFWAILEPKIAEKGAQLHKIVLQETNNNIIEYYGE